MLSLALLVVSSAPLFVLTMRGWAGTVLFVAAIAGVVMLAQGALPQQSWSPTQRRWILALILAYLAPLAATAFSAALRHDGYLPQFDAPSRFLVAIPIFLLVLRSGRSVGERMQWVLPIALLAALASLVLFGPDPRYDAGRDTTRVVGPLVFGYLSLTFGLMSLVSIDPREWRGGRRWGVLLRAAGALLGAYLSIRSGSRTGWLAAPLVVGIWGYQHWGRGRRFGLAITLATALLPPILAYLVSPVVQTRVDVGLREVLEYPWNGVLQEGSSVGYRIAFLRMAGDLLALHPWAGFGDTSHVPPLPPEAFPYVVGDVVMTAFRSGFHNQIVSNAVRLGIGGLLATTALMVMPVLVCAHGLRRGPAAARKDAQMGLAFSICLLVSSFTVEVLDLKYAASFYAVMTAAFCGAALGRRGEASVSA